jgi:hypothetical protein
MTPDASCVSATDLEILRDALHCLQTYRRIVPSEIHPYGRHAHPIDAVIGNLHRVIAKHDEIPELRPIANRPVTLDKDAWK